MIPFLPNPPKNWFLKTLLPVFQMNTAKRAATVSPIPHTALLRHDLTTPLSTEVCFPSPSIWTSVMRSLHSTECGRRTAWVPSVYLKRPSTLHVVLLESWFYGKSAAIEEVQPCWEYHNRNTHAWARWLTNPALHPSSHLHQGASQAILNLLHQADHWWVTSWPLLSHPSQRCEEQKNPDSCLN